MSTFVEIPADRHRLLHLAALVQRVCDGEIAGCWSLVVDRASNTIALLDETGVAQVRLELSDPSWRIDSDGRIRW